MADEIDRAQDRAQQWLADHIAHHARRLSRQAPPSAECVDCGQDIPAARRAAVPTACRCVRCQGLHEKQGGLRP